MRVLLTGAAGFIGTAVAEALESDGHEVVGVDAARAAGARARTGSARRAPSLDVRDAGAWRRSARRRRRRSATRPRWWGRSRRRPTCRRTPPHNDLGTAALLAAMHERE